MADDGFVFLQDKANWLELTDWRADNGLNPLITGDQIEKAPCPGQGASCWLEIATGQVAIAAQNAPAIGGCLTAAVLSARSAAGKNLDVPPCAFVGKSGAAIDLSGNLLTIRPAEMQNGHAWTQPLYAKPPKQDTPAKDQ